MLQDSDFGAQAPSRSGLGPHPGTGPSSLNLLASHTVTSGSPGRPGAALPVSRLRPGSAALPKPSRSS